MSESETVSLSVPEFAAPRADLDVASPAPYFLVGLPKLVTMMVITLGGYQLYWFYQHWARLKRHGGEDVWPILRTIFSGLFAYMLFDRINDDADAQGTPTLLGPAPLTALYVGAVVLLRFGLPEWVSLGMVTAVLVLVQRVVNGLPTVQALPSRERNGRFTVWNWVGVVLFLLLVLLIVLPDPELTTP